MDSTCSNSSWQTALAYEVAQRKSKKLQQQAAASASTSSSLSVDKVNAKVQKNTSNTRLQSFECFCCGKPGRTKTVCRFKDSSCHLFGRQGHLKAVCKINKSLRVAKVTNLKVNRAVFSRSN